MKETIFQGWQATWPTIKSSKLLETGVGVIDENAFNTMEVDQLFDAINHASTIIGQVVLHHSLSQPLDAISKVQEKQAALEELRGNSALKEALENVIETAATHEKNFYLLLFGEFLGTFGTAREEHEIEGYGYLQYKRGNQFGL